MFSRPWHSFRKEAETVEKALIIGIAIALGIGVSSAVETTAGGSLPKDLTLGSLSKVYEPVPFNHSAHVSAAGGCEDCHHQHASVQVQTCFECHRIDPSVFKKNVDTAKFKPCGECHAPSDRPGRIGLKTAYHQACLKCHKEDVGSGVKNLKGCTEMCHVLKTKGKPVREKARYPR
jgi:predicted CXXCH cytochrome family protein